MLEILLKIIVAIYLTKITHFVSKPFLSPPLVIFKHHMMLIIIVSYVEKILKSNLLILKINKHFFSKNTKIFLSEVKYNI